MKNLFFALMITLLLSLALFSAAIADHGDPVGSCPPGFTLHHFMDHSGEHMHRHIGVTQDLNGDGYICMQVITSNLHLHVDNSLPLP